MGLKAFHLLFIIASDLLAVGFGAWCLRAYGDTGEGMFLGLGIGGLASGFLLSGYLAWFLKKLRHVSFFVLALALVVPNLAEACAVCVGNPNHPLTISANMGVWFLLGCISFLLVGFAGIFVTWMRRAARLGA